MSLFIYLIGCGEIEGEAESLTISPASVTVGISRSQNFTVVAKDEYGFIITVTPRWSVSGNIGTISSSGLFTATDEAGSGYVIATYGDKTAQAAVTVTDTGWLEGTFTGMLGYASGIKVYLLENPALVDFSDSSGKYSIANIPTGTYWAVTVATEVYKAASQEVTIERGQTTTWSRYLEAQPGVSTTTTTLFSFD